MERKFVIINLKWETDMRRSNMYASDILSKSGNIAIHGAMTADYDPEKLKEYYRSWSATYDEDVEDEGYVGPSILVGLLRSPELCCAVEQDLTDPSLRIMDAGCGTGRVGKVLGKAGYKHIIGCDLSTEMAQRALQTGSYVETCGDIDLHYRNDRFGIGSFDVVTCCGTFTGGHVTPDALTELVRMTRPGGIIAISVRSSYYESVDFGSAYMRLVEDGHIRLSHSAVWAPYIDEESAHYFAFQALEAAS